MPVVFAGKSPFVDCQLADKTISKQQSLRCKCQTPSKRRTDGRTKRRDASLRPSVRSFVRSSLCPLCLSRACILYGGINRNAPIKKYI